MLICDPRVRVVGYPTAETVIFSEHLETEGGYADTILICIERPFTGYVLHRSTWPEKFEKVVTIQAESDADAQRQAAEISFKNLAYLEWAMKEK